jgi:hypothetical protein
MPKVLRTTTNENPDNPGTTTYYDDGTSSFDKSVVNPEGLTSQQMADKANAPVTPIETKPAINYGTDGTRTLTAADKFWADNPVSSNSDFKTQQDTTKEDFAKRQQDTIDSINNMYVGIISKADQTAKDKSGSANVINALSGQRGSASGDANVTKVNQANDSIMQGVLAEKQSKINTIMSNTYKDQTEELRYQNELRRKDLDSYLAYMGKKETENLTKSKEMRAALIKDNININDIAPDTLKQMADNAGYTVDQFKALYESERKTQEKAFLANEQKRLADLAKTTAETSKLTSEANKDPLVAKGYIPLTGKNDLEGLTENDIIRVGDKIYRKPANTKGPVTKTVGKDLYQYNDKTGGWDKVISAPGGGNNNSNEKVAISEMNKALSAVVGSDGFISPQDHEVLRKQWIDNGFSATTFDTKFKGYINPNNPNYVTTKKTKTTGRNLNGQ